MKTTIFAAVAICTAFIFAGCTPKEEAGTADNAGASAQKTAEPAAESKGTGDAGATLAMVKCDGCGGEFDKAKLTAHDGQNLCAKCLEAHGH